MTIPFFPAPISALDFNGRLICIPSSDRYEGFILALDQPDTLARFRRDMNPVAIPAVERDKEVKRLTEFATQIKAVGYSPSVVPTVRPAVEGIQIDDRGRLWIQRVTAASATEFDLFDQRGALVAVVECPFKPPTYFRPLFKGDRVWFIVAGEDDVPQVVRTRLVAQP